MEKESKPSPSDEPSDGPIILPHEKETPFLEIPEKGIEKERNNEKVWESLQGSLAELDPDHKLSRHLILMDRRISDFEKEIRKQKELETMEMIDDIFDQMIADGLNAYKGEEVKSKDGTQVLKLHPGIDEELRTLTKKLIFLIQRKRKSMGKGMKEYQPDDILRVAYQGWYEDFLHRHRLRDSGDFYARAHLFGATERLIKNIGICGMVSVTAEFEHDNPEDLEELHPRKVLEDGTMIPKINREALLPVEKYNWDVLIRKGYIKQRDLKEIEAEIEIKKNDVDELLEGLTKHERPHISKEGKSVNALKTALTTARRHGTRVLALKGADREHNMETLGTKGNPERRGAIAEETALVHGPQLQKVGFRQMGDRLIQLSFEHLNAGAVEDFIKKQRQRLYKYLGVEDSHEMHLAKHLSEILSHNKVVYVAIRPRSFGYYADTNQIRNEAYTINPDRFDTMFEIYIEVKSPRSGKDRNKKQQAWIKSVEDAVLRLRGAHDPNIKRDPREGVNIKIYNPELFPTDETTSMVFRINDSETEARRPRGWLTNDGDKNPDWVNAALRRIIQHAEMEGVETVSRMQELMSQELLGNRKTVYTPKMEPVELLENATGIDFAARVHTDLLTFCQGFILRDELGEEGNARQIWPFEEVPNKKVLSVVTSIRTEEDDRPLIKKETLIDLGWICFSGAYAQERIRRALRDREDDKEALQRGQEYIDRIHRLFFPGSNSDDVIYLLLSSTGKWSNLRKLEKLKRSLTEKQNLDIEERKNELESKLKNELLSQIGRGIMNPVEIIAAGNTGKNETLDFIEENERITIEMELPNQPEMMKEIAGILGKYGLNIGFSDIEEFQESNQAKFTVGVRLYDKSTPYDLMKAILRINYQYPGIRIKSEQFQKLTDRMKETLK